MSPKGPFRTKNSTAPESVFCCRRSFSVSVPFSCLFFLEKQALLSTTRSVCYCCSVFCLAIANLLSVLFLVRKGPLGNLGPPAPRVSQWKNFVSWHPSKIPPTCTRRPKRPKQTCTNSRPHALVCELQTGTNLHKFAPPHGRHPIRGPTGGGRCKFG